MTQKQGISKKKQRNKVKQDRRVSPKAKQKAKQRQKIHEHKKLAESKKRGSAAASRPQPKQKGDLLDNIRSADELFASGAFGDDQGEDEEEELEGEGVGDGEVSESSAGAFEPAGPGGDGDDQDDDLDLGGIDGLEEVEGGGDHEAELAAIREKDPAFYEFLVKHDKSLLDFRMPPGASAGERAEEDDAEKEEAEIPSAETEAAAALQRILTTERWERISASAATSFTACKAALNLYHTAVRSIMDSQDAEGQEDDAEKPVKGKKGKKKGGGTSKKKGKKLQIASEEIFSSILEWSLEHLLPALAGHAGEAKSKTSRKDDKGKNYSKQAGREAHELAPGVSDPSKLSRWKRVRILVQIFWEESYFLLQHLQTPQMVEFVLRCCSSPSSLAWLWVHSNIRFRFFRKVCQIWGSTSSRGVRLLSFLFIRNFAALAQHAPSEKKRKSDTPPHEGVVRLTMKAYAEMASTGYTWGSFNSFRFMENCLVELLRLDDAMAYRIGYAYIRQLALILRSYSTAVSQSAGGGKNDKKRTMQEKQAKSLVTWPFVRSMYLWTKAVSELQALRPLAYPLYMIIIGAVKSRVTSIQHFPFVYHCIRCLNNMAASLELFIPVSSYLLQAVKVVTAAMLKERKKSFKPKDGENTLSRLKVPDMEVLVRFTSGMAEDRITHEAVGSNICFLLYDHLGLVCRSPSFPEICVPVLMHLRKFSSHCRAESVRRQLKAFISSAETTQSEVKARRDALTSVPDFKRFLIFGSDLSLAKARDDMLQRRASEEKASVEAHLRSRNKQEKSEEVAEVPEGETKKSAKKRKQAEASDDAPKKKSKHAVARMVEGLPKGEDVLEEMDFSSGGEE
mmetsp:Transcript_53300/g.124841  ORF Transcript_53300/g.124841 Transcript_53300/m.124841 type:complete len:849 (+) Transcript_53300:40-2586(+)